MTGGRCATSPPPRSATPVNLSIPIDGGVSRLEDRTGLEGDPTQVLQRAVLRTLADVGPHRRQTFGCGGAALTLAQATGPLQHRGFGARQPFLSGAGVPYTRARGRSTASLPPSRHTDLSDVAELRDLAGDARELASQTRGAASRLGSAEGVDFRSRVAERYREQLRNEANVTERAAAQLDDAAHALMEHAEHVERTLARIAAVERWFSDRLSDAKRELSDAVDTVSRSATDILEHAPRAPAPGSPEWIEFARRWGV